MEHGRGGYEPPDAAEVQEKIKAGIEAGTLAPDEAIVCINAFRRARGLPEYRGPNQTPRSEPPDSAA